MKYLDIGTKIIGAILSLVMLVWLWKIWAASMKPILGACFDMVKDTAHVTMQAGCDRYCAIIPLRSKDEDEPLEDITQTAGKHTFNIRRSSSKLILEITKDGKTISSKEYSFT
jgi:hypothetical protein